MSLPKPPLALWITMERERKGWKVEELSRRLTDLGCQASPTTIRVWEAPRGRPPRRSSVEVMERLFGSQAPAQMGADGDLVAAILRLAEAVQAQADALMARESQHDALVRDLAAALAGLRAIPQDAPSSDALVPAGR